jgi:hypothetical protein
METEAGAMDVLCPGRFVSEEFPKERGLGKVFADDGHRAAIRLKEEKRTSAVAVFIGILQGKDTIGDDTEFQAAVYLNSPGE